VDSFLHQGTPGAYPIGGCCVLAARIGEKRGLNGESGGGVSDWAAAFKQKREEIAAARCF